MFGFVIMIYLNLMINICVKQSVIPRQNVVRGNDKYII